MRRELALRLLADVMEWDMEKARTEFLWLSLISRIKYDGYRDFLAGVRFLESLAHWLQQFRQPDRQHAYAFVRSRLAYVSEAEIRHLVELMYYEHVEKRLRDSVAARVAVPAFEVWGHPRAQREYRSLLRRTLFLALSDGARLDTFRRSTTDWISNEQVVVAHQLNADKWHSLLADLRADLSNGGARFAFVYLVDDFVGSGRTLLRRVGTDPGVWEGKMSRFWQVSHGIADGHFENDWVLCVHYHLASSEATQAIAQRNAQASRERQGQWFERVEFSYGMILPETFPISEGRDGAFWQLTENYYDPAIESQHSAVGETDLKRGFAGCALPLVLEHNTPNNSVALLWAESSGDEGRHPVIPLFRRSERHS